MALISVIIPCYNVENLIDRTMLSIERQTIGFANLEIILVDDCSTDNTVCKLENWENKYPDNILIIKCKENRRQGEARNIGLSYASTEYIGFLDSDDWIEPTYFEKLYNIMLNGDYQCVSCKSIRDKSKEYTLLDSTVAGGENREYIIDSEEKRKEIILLPPITYSAWAKLIKKSFLVDNELYFPKDLTYEDAGWGSLFHLYIERAYVLDENLYHYYVNESSTVLTNNSSHHLDCYTIQILVWQEYEKRGFLNKYREELEVEHIYSFYLAALKAMIIRYEVPNYNAYLLLRVIMLQHVPDYTNNKYIKDGGRFNEFYMLILESLRNELTKQEFLSMADKIRVIGI